MSRKIFTVIVIALLMAVPVMADGSGSVNFSGSGQVITNVWEGSHSEHYLNVTGTNIGSTYSWNTDTYPGRGTALVGNLNVNSGGDAYTYFSNWVDFSQTDGSGIGYQATEVWGNQISIAQNADRHQGYAMTETINLSVAGPESTLELGGGYLIGNYMTLRNSGGTLIASHNIEVSGSGSASLVDVGWAHAAVRSGGLQFDSNGGNWGPTGQPIVTATGAGTFSQIVYGSTYAMWGVGAVGGGIQPVITMPGGGTINVGGPFAGGLTAQNMAARANSGGI